MAYQSIHTKIITESSSLKLIREDWNLLLDNTSTTNSIFQTFEWNYSWWNVFGNNNELLVILVYDGKSLLGIAPLMISKRKFFLKIKTRVVSFIGTPNSSDYGDFIIMDGPTEQIKEVAVSIFNWMYDNRHNWDELNLFNIPEQSLEMTGVMEFFHNKGIPSTRNFLYNAPTRILGNNEEDRKILNKKSLKRHYNYFKRTGSLSFKHCETREEINSYLDTFFRQHIDRRRLTLYPSQFLDSREKEFFKELVSQLLPMGWLRFSTVLYNGAPIAFHFGFEYNKTFIWYKPTFDIKHSKKAPGEVLLRFLLEYAINMQCKEFDFTIGEEFFKYRFSNHTRSIYHFRSFSKYFYYIIFLATFHLNKNLRCTLKSIKPVKALWHFIKKYRIKRRMLK